MRKFALLVSGVALSIGTLTACVGGPPPPPPSGPQDVLVVGDSLAYSYGCVLGDAAGSGDPCSGQAEFTTKNGYVGACNIGGGSVLTYDGLALGSYSCSDWRTSWANLADQFQPKVVVINTSGWEIVDRWANFPNFCNAADASNCPVAPDRQWGGTNYTAARDGYAQNLTEAINLFRSRGADVLVANSPYTAPPQPFFVEGSPTWYERYQTDQGDWVPPSNASGYTYRPSKAKIDQLNATVASVVSGFGGTGVSMFDAYKHFSPGGVYSAYICPPPNDGIAPGAGNSCPGGQSAILARDPDGAHLIPSSPGGNDVLRYYLQPCVRALLGVTGGDVTKCS